MAAVDRRNPNLDDFVGLNWSCWVDGVNIFPSDGESHPLPFTWFLSHSNVRDVGFIYPWTLFTERHEVGPKQKTRWVLVQCEFTKDVNGYEKIFNCSKNNSNDAFRALLTRKPTKLTAPRTTVPTRVNTVSVNPTVSSVSPNTITPQREDLTSLPTAVFTGQYLRPLNKVHSVDLRDDRTKVRKAHLFKKP